MLGKEGEKAREGGVDTQGGGGRNAWEGGWKNPGKTGWQMWKVGGICPVRGESPGMPGGTTGNKTDYRVAFF